MFEWISMVSSSITQCSVSRNLVSMLRIGVSVLRITLEEGEREKERARCRSLEERQRKGRSENGEDKRL